MTKANHINVAHITFTTAGKADLKAVLGSVAGDTQEMRGFTHIKYEGGFVRCVWMKDGVETEAVAYPAHLVLEVVETLEEE